MKKVLFLAAAFAMVVAPSTVLANPQGGQGETSKDGKGKGERVQYYDEYAEEVYDALLDETGIVAEKSPYEKAVDKRFAECREDKLGEDGTLSRKDGLKCLRKAKRDAAKDTKSEFTEIGGLPDILGGGSDGNDIGDIF